MCPTFQTRSGKNICQMDFISRVQHTFTFDFDFTWEHVLSDAKNIYFLYNGLTRIFALLSFFILWAYQIKAKNK